MLPSNTGRRAARTPRSVPGLRNELDRLFEDFFDRQGPDASRVTPPTDLWETEDAFAVEMEAPGFERDDFDVAIDRGTLTVTGVRDVDAAEDQDFHLRERAAGRFRRSFSLPASVRTQDVTARYEDGVLRVDLPKAEEARTKKIEVDVG